MSKETPYRLTVQMSYDEEQMIDVLKAEYSINLSHLVKKHIKDTFNKLESLKDA